CDTGLDSSDAYPSAPRPQPLGRPRPRLLTRTDPLDAEGSRSEEVAGRGEVSVVESLRAQGKVEGGGRFHPTGQVRNDPNSLVELGDPVAEVDEDVIDLDHVLAEGERIEDIHDVAQELRHRPLARGVVRDGQTRRHLADEDVPARPAGGMEVGVLVLAAGVLEDRSLSASGLRRDLVSQSLAGQDVLP